MIDFDVTSIVAPITDRRLDAARLSRDQFVGTLNPHGSNQTSDFSAFSENQWARLPEQTLLVARNIPYSLRYTPDGGGVPNVYLLCGSQLVGVYYGHFLHVTEDHQRKNLSSELILAAYDQCPWNDPELTRDVTEEGEKAFLAAYRYITKVLTLLSHT